MKAGQVLSWRESRPRIRVHPALVALLLLELVGVAVMAYFAVVPA